VNALCPGLYCTCRRGVRFVALGLLALRRPDGAGKALGPARCYFYLL